MRKVMLSGKIFWGAICLLPQVSEASFCKNALAQEIQDKVLGTDYRQVIQAEGTWSELIIDGKPVRALAIPSDHGMGRSQMYEIEVNGEKRVIKSIKTTFGASLEEYEKKVLAGSLLGEKFGGPKIYRSGIVEIPGKGKRIFVEMEKIAANEDSFTLKHAYERQDEKLRKELLEEPGQKRINKIVDTWIDAMESGVFPLGDAEFILTKDNARPIDTSEWSVKATGLDPHDIVRTYNHFNFYSTLDTPNRLTNELGFAFLDNFLRSLKKSSVLTSNYKASLIKYFDAQNYDPVFQTNSLTQNVRSLYEERYPALREVPDGQFFDRLWGLL